MSIITNFSKLSNQERISGARHNQDIRLQATIKKMRACGVKLIIASACLILTTALPIYFSIQYDSFKVIGAVLIGGIDLAALVLLIIGFSKFKKKEEVQADLNGALFYLINETFPNFQEITKLIEMGADLQAVNNSPVYLHRPVELAIYYYRPMVAEQLIESGAAIPEIDFLLKHSQSVLYSHTSFFKTLVDGQCNLNQGDGQGNTLLHHAIQLGHWDKAIYLIEKGATLTLKNYEGKTPLTCQDRRGMTLLDLISSSRFVPFALFNKILDAKPDLSGNKGIKALKLATESNQFDKAGVLVSLVYKALSPIILKTPVTKTKIA